MGSLTSRPVAPKSEWQPHITLQKAYEVLTEEASKGASIAKDGDEFVLTAKDGTVKGKTICDTIMQLLILRGGK